MHKNVTHNRCYAKFNGFCAAMLMFLREDVPKNWTSYCDAVTDNFRVISQRIFGFWRERGMIEDVRQRFEILA